MSETGVEVVVRRVEKSDLPQLSDFFIKSYGEQTVFQDENFLEYYFISRYGKSVSLLCTTNSGEIVSHYGGLQDKLNINGEVINIVWGVNAYTLTEWRGKGFNSKIVDYLHKNNEANAVIGMPTGATAFYKKLGYNIFDDETLDRYIYNLDAKTFEIVAQIEQDVNKSKALFPVKENHPTDIPANIVELTKENFKDFDLDLQVTGVTATVRDLEFLEWRLFNNPYIEYTIWGYLKNNKVISYVVNRIENLEPNNYKVTRIVDLFGDSQGIASLLIKTINESMSSSSIYIDFSMIGNLYSNELKNNGFDKLENEDAALLPRFTAPVQHRPNHENLVIQSKTHDNLIQNLSESDVYFTRIDTDRDRIARITQIKK